jgi:cytochrome d ubiquinol oxidase subunit I
MQHPVGYELNPTTGRAQLNDIWAVMTNPVFVWAYLHVLLAALVTASVVMLGVSAFHLRRKSSPDVFGRSARLAIVVLVPSTLLALMVGSHLGVIETTYQPMKVAAMEAQWETCGPCSFSAFQIGGGSHDQTPTKIIQIPHLLSLLATDSWNGQVIGLNELQAQYEQQYGPGNYIPNVFIQYWSMRVMAYGGALVFLFALVGGWLMWRRKLDTARRYLWVAMVAVPVPFILNTAGWMLTENGRQPWIVQGLLLTRNGVSPSVSTTALVVSILVFLLLYGALALVDAVLMTHYARKEIEAPVEASA